MAFRQARWFTPTNGRAIDLLVVHDMEAPERATTAETVADYFATTSVKASAHYCVDTNSVVQCVRDQDVAYHAPGANHNGLGIEHAGYARQSAAEWADPYSRAMLREVSAPLAAGLCRAYSIPPVWLSATDLKLGARGITSHWNVSLAFGRSTHTDPGPNFPAADFVAWVGTILNRQPIPEEPMGLLDNPPVLCTPLVHDAEGRWGHWTWDADNVYAWDFPPGAGGPLPNAAAKAHMGPIRGLMADTEGGYILTAGTPGQGSKMSTYRSRDFPDAWRA